jgi:hypothetical protein
VAGTCPTEPNRHAQLAFASSTANGCVWSFTVGLPGVQGMTTEQLTMDCTTHFDAGGHAGCIFENGNGVCNDLTVGAPGDSASFPLEYQTNNGAWLCSPL